MSSLSTVINNNVVGLQPAWVAVGDRGVKIGKKTKI